MKPTYSRLERRFYGLPEPEEALPTLSLSELRLSQKATTFLEAHSPGTGIYRGGPLFGYAEEGVLYIEYATVGTIVPRRSGQDDPLALDAEYVLGYAKALQNVDERLEWKGHWMAFPEAMKDDPTTCFGHLERGNRLGLLDLQRPLLFLAYQVGDWMPQAFILRDWVPEQLRIAGFPLD